MIVSPAHRIATAGLLLAGLLVGCAAMSAKTDAPRISLAAIRVTGIKALETSFEVDLRILNPSDRQLSISGLTCQLTLGGKQLADGVAGPQTDIEPYSDGLVTVSVYSSMLNMIGIARRLMQATEPAAEQAPISYAVSGHLQTGTSGWFGRVPFEDSGEIDLAGMARSLQ